MIIHFDGGLRKQLIAIVNADTNEIIIEKRKYDNEYYEWDALELALDYAKKTYEPILQLVGDNNQVIRWIQEDNPICGDSIIKQKCLEKLNILKKERHVYARWVKRHENLAGRVLEYHTRRSNKPTRYIGAWYGCPKCTFKSLNEKEKSEHFYNNHITIG